MTVWTWPRLWARQREREVLPHASSIGCGDGKRRRQCDKSRERGGYGYGWSCSGKGKHGGGNGKSVGAVLYRDQRCRFNCGRVHCCQICFGNRPAARMPKGQRTRTLRGQGQPAQRGSDRWHQGIFHPWAWKIQAKEDRYQIRGQRSFPMVRSPKTVKKFLGSVSLSEFCTCLQVQRGRHQ